MPFSCFHITLPKVASSPGEHTSASMAEIKAAIIRGHVEAVRARLGQESLSCEAWHALREHVLRSRSAPAIKESLQQVLADAALKHAVRANDIDTAKQALLCGAEPEGIPAHAVADDNMRALLTYARRKNKLYPPNGPHGPETALDHALRNGQEETATTLLLQAAGYKNIREVWRDAVKGKQVDVQRALLLLGYADEDRGIRLLQEDAVTDPGVIAVMKEIPYFSPKRGLPRNFNGQAMFPDTSEEIVCRHLVEHRQATLEQSDRRKFDDVQYASVQNIAANVSYATEAQRDHLKAHAAETHLFHNHDFGKVLVGQFGEMQRKTETSRLLLLSSSDHAMSVELKVKDKDGKLHYVAALFDPNTTTSHIRFASDDVRTLEGLTLKGLLPSEDLHKYYYRNSQEISIIFVRPLGPAQAQAEPARENRVAGAVENRTLTSCIDGEQLNGTALYFMLSNGFAGDIRRLKSEIAKRPQLLEFKIGEGISGLYRAFRARHADTIAAVGEVLVESEVPRDKCVELLAAKRLNDSVPGFSKTLQHGCPKTIRAFGQVLKDLKVPLSDCIELLEAKSGDGVSGLYMALQNGHADAIAAFGQVLTDLKVPLSDCIKLLEAKSDDGVSGLYKALRNGHADAIPAFGQVLTELQVPPDECAELLNAKRGDGVSGLYMALRYRKLEAVEQYIQLVKKIAPELSDKQRAALLKEVRTSYARYEELKKDNPGFYQRFKEMKDALKERTR